jgi:glycosyltransferase involved in cell wall biosynthesis
VRIINIIENLDKGAVENWLVDIFIESRKNRPDWKWTFYCILGKEGRLDEKVRNAGGEIIYSPVTVSNKFAFLKNLRDTLKRGRYDILHAHHDYLSGFYLLASVGIKFKRKFLHVHNTDKALPVGNRILHNLLLGPFRQLGLLLTDQVIGISRNTLEEFAGRKNVPDKKFNILYYGVKFDRFDITTSKAYIFNEFNLPENARLMLYAGRMNELKNPDFVVDVLAEVLKTRNDVYAVFIGQGERQSAVKSKADELKISDHIRIFDWHNNVPAVMNNADVFVFPRKQYPKEGLGLVVIEAQAAGLPMFITDGIVNDAIVVDKLAYINDLSDPTVWAQQIVRVLDTKVPLSRNEALAEMKQSPFELSRATQNLVDIYER